MVTMRDVAREARVSASTVSHVINGTRKVSDRVREQVSAAVIRTGYQREDHSRLPGDTTTTMIGVAISAYDDPFCSRLIGAIEAKLREDKRKQFMLLPVETHDDPERELFLIRTLKERAVEGIMLAPVGTGMTRTLDEIRRMEMPVVLVDRCASGEFDQVGTENEKSMWHLVDHLIDHGRRRIGLIHSKESIATTAERKVGYLNALQKRGLEPDERIVVDGGAEARTAADAVRHLLDLPDPPDALVVGNGPMTIGVLETLRLMNRRVPDDISLVCFDDPDWAGLVSPPLTTIRQAIEEIGAWAVDLLLSRIETPSVQPRTRRTKTSFFPRQSCGCRAIGSYFAPVNDPH